MEPSYAISAHSNRCARRDAYPGSTARMVCRRSLRFTGKVWIVVQGDLIPIYTRKLTGLIPETRPRTRGKRDALLCPFAIKGDDTKSKPRLRASRAFVQLTKMRTEWLWRNWPPVS